MTRGEAGKKEEKVVRTTVFSRWFRVIALLIVLITGSIVLDLRASELRVAPLNPEFVAYMKALKEGKLMSSQTSEGRAFGLIPDPVDISQLIESDLPRAPLSLPASYDLRVEGRLPPIRDQGGCGSCWTFAAMGSLESYLIGQGELWDFSENNLKECGGFSTDPCVGGNVFMFMAYFARRSGPIREEDDPYFDYPTGCIPNLTPQKYVNDMILIPFYDDNLLKQSIIDYGAVFVSMESVSGAYNSEHFTYYNDGSYGTGVGHALCIVGWDDTFDRDLFNTTPPGDGAWIVRNSWGTDFGESGYFYASYYDTQFGFNRMLLFAEDPDNTTLYQYDPLGRTTYVGYETSTAWAANVFTADVDQELLAVSTYAVGSNTAYEIYIKGAIDDPNGAAVATGTFDYFGYHTVDLSSPIHLSNGQSFVVVVKLTKSGYLLPIPVEHRILDYTDAAAANPGESYTSEDGTPGSWEDLTNWDPTANVCIKAIVVQPDAIVDVTVLDGDGVGVPDADIYVNEAWYGTTGPGGTLDLDLVEGMHYDILAHSSDAQLLLYDGVTAPGSLVLDCRVASYVTVNAKKRGGSPLDVGLYFELGANLYNVAHTPSGNGWLYITPGLYDFHAWSYYDEVERYDLVFRGEDLTGSTSLTIDTAAMPTARWTLDTLTGGYDSWSLIPYPSGFERNGYWVFEPGDSLILNAGDWDCTYVLNVSLATWSYRHSLFDLSLVGGEEFHISAGGDLTLSTWPEEPAYVRGGTAKIWLELTDQYGNPYTWVDRYNSSAAPPPSVMARPTDGSQSLLHSAALGGTWEVVYPWLTVTPPSEPAIFDAEVGLGDWVSVDLDSNAELGTYGVRSTLQTHLGEIEGVSSFLVCRGSVDVTVLDGDGVGVPGADIYVNEAWYGVTGPDGTLDLDLVDGMHYDILAHSSDAQLLLYDGVTAPESLVLDCRAASYVTVNAKKRDGSPLDVGLYFELGANLYNVAHTPDGNGWLYITPGLYDFHAWSYYDEVERYDLAFRGEDLTSSTSLTIDTATMPTARWTLDTLTGSYASWALIPSPSGFERNGYWVFEPGDSLILNAGDWDCTYVLKDSSYTWYYEHSFFELSLVGGEEFHTSAGGDLALSTWPEEPACLRGGTAKIWLELTDQYGNPYDWVGRYDSSTAPPPSVVAQPTGGSQSLLRSATLGGTWEDVYPWLAVTPPSGPAIFDAEVRLGDWVSVDLDSNAELGTYGVRSTLQAHLGEIEGVSSVLVYEESEAVFRADRFGNVFADMDLYGQGIATGQADVAEWVPVSEPVQAGDVLELDPLNPGFYRRARAACSTLVAGVVSSDPGVVLGGQPSTSDSGPATRGSRPGTLDSRLSTRDSRSTLLAVIGVVPVKVTDAGGPIAVGDLLVAASESGYARRWVEEDGPNCGFIGKALEALVNGKGVIRVLLMR